MKTSKNRGTYYSPFTNFQYFYTVLPRSVFPILSIETNKNTENFMSLHSHLSSFILYISHIMH